MPTSMDTLRDLPSVLDTMGYEQVTVCRDPSVGYLGIIAVHSTLLGPALGGTRVWQYRSFGEALEDALRLSRGMTYKNALAGLPFGGGKAVIFGPAPQDSGTRAAFFGAHGRFVERMGGLFVTGEDVGTTPRDMECVADETAHVAGLERGMGDPSPFTARGVFRALEAVATELWGSPDLSGRKVALQGLGNVGTHLARALRDRDVQLVVADVDPARAGAGEEELGAEVVSPEEILDVDADIFAPCALGGVLDADSVERLRVRAVCGGANSQLRDPEQGERLREREILYVPDYVANAGGVISGSVDLAGWGRTRMDQALEGIYDTVRKVFEVGRRLGIDNQRAADRMVEDRLGESARSRSPERS